MENTVNTLKGAMHSGVVGSLTAAAMGGISSVASKNVGAEVGRGADVEASLSSIQDNYKEMTRIDSRGTLTAEKENVFQDNIEKNYRQVEDALKKTNEKNRARLIEKFGLSEMFDEKTGKMTDAFSEQLSVQRSLIGKTPLYGNMTVNMRYQLSKIESDVAEIEELWNKPSDGNPSGNQDSFTVTDTPLTEDGQKRFNDLKKFVYEKLKGNVGLVVLDTTTTDFHAAKNTDGTAIYVSRADVESEAGIDGIKSMIHETYHITEGTDSSVSLFTEMKQDPALYESARDEIVQNGYATAEDVDAYFAARESGNNGAVEGLSDETVSLIESELGAAMAEKTFGNEAFFKKAIRDNVTLAQKILNHISDRSEYFSHSSSKESRAEYRRYLKMEKLYIKAAEEAGFRYENGRLIGRSGETDDGEEVLDKSGEVRYSKSKDRLIGMTFPPYNKSGSEANELATRWAHREDVKAGWQSLISYHDRWYLIEKFDDSDLGYQIVERLSKKEYERYTGWKNGRNAVQRSIQKSTAGIGSLDRRGNRTVGRERGSDSVETRHARENQQIQSMGSIETSQRQTSSDGNGDRRSGGGGEQGSDLKFRKTSSTTENDWTYLEAVKNGDMETAEKMVREAAEKAGYTSDSSWRMQHKAPNSQEDVSLADLKESGLVPIDFWEHPEWYIYSSEERESYYKVKNAIEMLERRKAEGKHPDARIWVYRAVDKTVNTKEDYFRNGDWVTPSYDYAVNEGRNNPNGYRIIKHSVSIKNLYWDGNSIAELGFDDGSNYAYKDTLNNRKLLDVVTYDDDGNVIPLSERFNKKNSDIRFRKTSSAEVTHRKITADMTEEERYEALKDRKLTLAAKTDSEKLRLAKEKLSATGVSLSQVSYSEKRKLLKKLGEEFGVYKPYENADVELDFSFSRENLKESVNKQKKSFENFAKMLSCFDDVIENAVGIEVHNRNDIGYKVDANLKNVYVLVSAFEDGELIVPVKLAIKELANDPNMLYVAIALEGIKKDEVVTSRSPDTDFTSNARSSTISIPDLFRKINPSDESFLKYVPKKFLEDGVRFRKTNGEDYTYQNLTSKPDMKVTLIRDGIDYVPSKQTRNNLVDRAMKNAASVGYTNENGNVFVHVNDIETDVMIGKNAIRHGIDRRLNILGPVVVKSGEILQNSIRINELSPRDANIDHSYVLIGMAKNQTNQPYVVEFVVNAYTNEVSQVDVLYSVNAKDVGVNGKQKGTSRTLVPGVPAQTVRYLTDSTISISHLLDFVNTYFPDVLPEDVLKHYGVSTRPDGVLGKSVLFRKTYNPAEIANMKQEEASTTPKVDRKDGKADGDSESRSYESYQKSSIFDDTFKKEVKSDDFIRVYQSVTNKDTFVKASNELDSGGEAYVRKWFAKPIDETNLIDRAVGFILMHRYQSVQDYDSAIAAAEKVREMGTVAGQEVQIFSILNKFDPAMMAAYSQNTLDKSFELMKKGRTAEWISKNESRFQLTDAEKDFIMTKTMEASRLPEGRDQLIRLAEIKRLLENKLPPEKGQALKALQRISMLLNVKTNIRNIIGNAGMTPVFIASDFFGAIIDKGLAHWSGVRTTGIGVKGIKKSATAFIGGAEMTIDDFKRKINTRIEEMNRFEIGQAKPFDEHHQGKAAKELNALAKALNAVDRFTSFLLEFGDRPFYEMWFANSLNNQMRLNHVSEPTAEMVEIAANEALQRTWQDNNKMVAAVSKVKSSLNVIQIGGYGLGDVFIKFVKTPANLTKAIFDFSPAGLLKSIIFDARKFMTALKNGQFTAKVQKQFVDSLSKGISGTLLYILAMALYNAGRLKGDTDEDKDVSSLEKYILGMPSYSVRIGDTWLSYDWAQPVGSVFASVSNFMESRQNNPDNGFGNDVLEAIRAGGNVLYNQSFMQSLQYLFSADSIIDGLIDAIVSEPSVLVPQFLSQVASLTDDSRRTTYVSGKPIDTAKNKVLYKIPGLRQTLEKEVDVLGRDVPNSQSDVFNAFFNPANTYSNTSSEVVEQLYSIYKMTGDASVIPRKAPNYILCGGVKYTFSTSERAQYQRVSGQASESILKTVLSEKWFLSMTSEEQSEVISRIYNYSAAKAKSQFVYPYEVLSTMYEGLTRTEYAKMTDENKRFLAEQYFMKSYEKMDLFEKAGIDFALILRVTSETGDLKGDIDKNGETIPGSRKKKIEAYVQSLRLSAAEKYMIMGYLGYKNKNGKQVVRTYIQRLKLKKEQKEKLFAYCGYGE